MANRNISEMTGVLGLARNSAVSAPTFKAYGTWYSGGSGTTTKPHILIEPTGTTSTGWSTSGTGIGVNAASGFTGNLIDLQLNGSSYFKVGQFGAATLAGTLSLTSGNCSIGTGSLTFGGASDLVLKRGAANILELVRSSNAQTFNIYNTYTDASNYERGFVKWSANALEIGCEAAGTGTARVVHISNLPTSNPGAGILWNNAGTPAIGT